MAVTGIEGIILLVGRIVFGGVIAFTGLNHFMQTEQMTGYAEHKGLPAPKLGVIGSGIVLVLGGLSVILGVFPIVATIVIAGFLIVAGVVFHDFWAVPEEQQQTEMTQFLKNVAMAGGALVIAAVGPQQWAYSLDLSLF
ncbi:DoxX family protein [Natrinema salifodinae]|uniref:Tat (Twin-arginine translocation) pathway signal sequence n=1 Tax=Natrinema salifodinae TaxID=1202768 RepID=A0A1I0PMZ7_9EURY|nr:DoxX family protein [Natrinema salifodinae]SEW15784.1 Tat (twin-arginine translocation) pathway signal sequence [Natrinema salifodinae]